MPATAIRERRPEIKSAWAETAPSPATTFSDWAAGLLKNPAAAVSVQDMLGVSEVNLREWAKGRSLPTMTVQQAIRKLAA